MSGIAEWYVAHNGQSVGPMTIDELVNRLPEYGVADRLHQSAVARVGQIAQACREFGLERPALMQHGIQHPCRDHAGRGAGGGASRPWVLHGATRSSRRPLR